MEINPRVFFFCFLFFYFCDGDDDNLCCSGSINSTYIFQSFQAYGRVIIKVVCNGTLFKEFIGTQISMPATQWG